MGLFKLSCIGSITGLLMLPALVVPVDACAHCDTMNGPVVQDARRALESGDLSPVLKWIREANEPDVRAAFETALGVRSMGEKARGLADQYFFETVVRIHRAGEGAPYEGLKSAESIPPVVVSADQALVTGSVEALARDISATVAEEIQRRFQAALQRRASAEDSPEAGRQFVSAYVDYVHFVEAVHGLVNEGGHGHESVNSVGGDGH